MDPLRVWLLVAFTTWHSYCLAHKSYVDELPETDLLSAIKIPFDDPNTQYFENGADGFPAMGIRPGSDIKSPYRLFMQERFYPEFSILFTIKLADKEGGFLFAVVNPLETLVELGVSVKGIGPGESNVSLLYTDPSTYSSETIASFVVPTSFSRWATVTLKVTTEEVAVGYNCQPLASVQVKRIPLELVFDSASTLYIGQAGPIIKGALHLSAFDVFYIIFGALMCWQRLSARVLQTPQRCGPMVEREVGDL